MLYTTRVDAALLDTSTNDTITMGFLQACQDRLTSETSSMLPTAWSGL